jgi:hypothetical protein
LGRDVVLHRAGQSGAEAREGGEDPWRHMKTARIRIIKHETVPECGSFEVRFADGRPSQYFYWDDIPARRMRPETLDRETALQKAKAVARAASVR